METVNFPTGKDLATRLSATGSNTKQMMQAATVTAPLSVALSAAAQAYNPTPAPQAPQPSPIKPGG